MRVKTVKVVVVFFKWHCVGIREWQEQRQVRALAPHIAQIQYLYTCLAKPVSTTVSPQQARDPSHSSAKGTDSSS
jgi:hypothetical protein